ncbi:MAG TPA: ABC transporter ATP-binding protein [Spirochaetota bacterium]|nr:ABC transporter ATP-binding protein [Spirochaetota bacterium]
MISLLSVSKSFRGQPAVDSLECEIMKGEIFGIVGPDGAGKSTLLRMMAVILVPDQGQIFVEGENVFSNPFKAKERIAYMPQRFGLYEDLTVEENIFFFGKLFGLTSAQIRKKLPMLYDFSNLGPFGTRKAGKLSGGMKQKLGLACCLVHEPEIILLDEPTNGVDPVSRREFWKILYDLLGRGVTIVVSTAYLDEAERCGRIALMYRGKFIRLGTPGEIKKMTGKPLLEIICDDPRRAEDLLRHDHHYRRVIRTGSSLRLFINDPGVHSRAIRKNLSQNGIAVKKIGTIVPSLEDTFVEVIEKGGAQ